MSESSLITLSSHQFATTQHPIKHISKDLSSIITTKNKPNHLHCGHVELPTHELHSCFETSFQSLRQSLISATVEYLQLGIRYFDIPSKARASTTPTNPAHSQYGIEARQWMDDPFIAPWAQAIQIVVQAEEKLRSQTLVTDTAGWICEKIEEGRALVRAITVDLGRIEEGVEQIEDDGRICTFGRTIKMRALERKVEREERDLDETEKEARRVCRQKQAREALHDAERRALLRLAFEQARFEQWKRRIEGFERME